MITTSREEEFETKWQVIDTNDGEINSKASSSSTSRWRLKDPRIVRVSRAFGGKDRHSKVCTVRGVRDRRVRLSVPTAIQLYDLQDRLGLNQPSKVVDWLLDAAKHEIDELPPLQIPPENFGMISHQQLLGTSQANKEGPSIDSGIDLDGSSFWNLDHELPPTDGLQNFNAGGMPLTSTLSQALVRPPGTAQSYNFPSLVSSASVEFDPKQMNYFQMLSSSSQSPLSNSPTPALYPFGQSNNNEELPTN